MGVGVQVSRKLGVEGEDMTDVNYGVEFLKAGQFIRIIRRS